MALQGMGSPGRTPHTPGHQGRPWSEQAGSQLKVPWLHTGKPAPTRGWYQVQVQIPD